MEKNNHKGGEETEFLGFEILIRYRYFEYLVGFPLIEAQIQFLSSSPAFQLNILPPPGSTLLLHPLLSQTLHSSIFEYYLSFLYPIQLFPTPKFQQHFLSKFWEKYLGGQNLQLIVPLTHLTSYLITEKTEVLRTTFQFFQHKSKLHLWILIELCVLAFRIKLNLMTKHNAQQLSETLPLSLQYQRKMLVIIFLLFFFQSQQHYRQQFLQLRDLFTERTRRYLLFLAFHLLWVRRNIKYSIVLA